MNKLDFGKRPPCSKCGKDRQFIGKCRKDGSPIFRKLCGACHGKAVAKKRGLKNLVHVLAKNKGMEVKDYIKETTLATAKNQGFNSISEYLCSLHPYKKYRKDYCENAKGTVAGWLGFICTTNIVMPNLQLDTDHLDGNPFNNEKDNLHTLCKCCHAIKTNIFMDYATKGRKKGKSNDKSK